MLRDLPKMANDDKLRLPEYSPGLGRWIFMRPQPKATRKPLKLGRWLLLAVAIYLIIQGAR